jgi:2-iminobutanoate/2-iminopropanoate deaminase
LQQPAVLASAALLINNAYLLTRRIRIMPRTLLHSKSIPAPRFRYTPCIKTGPFYQLSGMIALMDGAKLAPGGAYGETQYILANLQKALKDYGLGLEHLTIARIFTTRFDQFPEINRAWEEVFGNIDPPARTSIGVANLPLNAAVEIEFAAYKED